jgi:WD40 repeat protein
MRSIVSYVTKVGHQYSHLSIGNINWKRYLSAMGFGSKVRRVLIFTLIFILKINVTAQQLELAVQTGHAGGIVKAAVSLDERFLFTAGIDREIAVWHIEQQRQFATLSGHKDEIQGISWYNHGLWSVAADSTLIVWDLEHASIRAKYPLPEKPTALFVYDNILRIATDKALYSFNDGVLTLLAHVSGIIHMDSVYNAMICIDYLGNTFTKPQQSTQVSQLPYNNVVSIAGGNSFFYTTRDGKILRINEKGKRSGATSGFPLIYFNQVIAGTNGHVIVAQPDGKMHFFQSKNWEKLATVQGHQSSVSQFVLTNDAGDTIETLDNVLNFFNGKVINLNIVMSGSFSEKALSYLTGLIMQNAKFILTTNNYDYYNYFPKNKNFYFM